MNGKKLLGFVLTFVLLLSFVALPAAAQEPPVKNVIFFIGDGMGPSHVILARDYSLFVLGKELEMTKVMNKGSTAFMTNHALDRIATDSAAAATAMATGYKTNNAMLSMTPDGIPRITVLEKAQDMGKSVGVVSTTRLTHATPAGFIAHIDHRDKENEIAVQMLESGADVMLAGGWRHWVPKSVEGSKREDERDLTAEAEKLGYTVVRDAAGLRAVDPAATDKLLGLFTKSHMSYELDRDPEKEPSLAEMTAKAIEILSKNEKGFFLMVEGGRIDHAAHDNDAAGVIHDTLAFDEAVGVGLDFLASDPNTLIIVTADHETGGLTLTEGKLATEEEIDYMSVEDLRLIGQIDASFEAMVGEMGKEPDAATVKEVVKKHTGIELTDEEVETILAEQPWQPIYYLPQNGIGRALADELSINFASGQHSAEPLMLAAIGPCSEWFTGLLDNTDVAKLISKAFQTGY